MAIHYDNLQLQSPFYTESRQQWRQQLRKFVEREITPFIDACEPAQLALAGNISVASTSAKARDASSVRSLLTWIDWPSKDTISHSKTVSSLMRLAQRKGSTIDVTPSME